MGVKRAKAKRAMNGETESEIAEVNRRLLQYMEKNTQSRERAEQRNAARLEQREREREQRQRELEQRERERISNELISENQIMCVDLDTIRNPAQRAWIENEQARIMAKRSQPPPPTPAPYNDVWSNYYGNIGGNHSDF